MNSPSSVVGIAPPAAAAGTLPSEACFLVGLAVVRRGGVVEQPLAKVIRRAGRAEDVHVLLGLLKVLDGARGIAQRKGGGAAIQPPEQAVLVAILTTRIRVIELLRDQAVLALGVQSGKLLTVSVKRRDTAAEQRHRQRTRRDDRLPPARMPTAVCRETA